ncbi:Sodium/hydrogen exchanger family-domain-containing protein [Jimgerdemannia flammicorona]|uniref:Sodium/hydrogen exchanger family-domain-containing protein n=1 Tax=Jimgerdemannia flammicorona TaxID=994334 RepID=A0A433Q9U7_9FUNG|nr:Sodium/hydrogen exchanger family-domain-containing protein [Jimgerdemannia flammicorona]
MYLTPLLLLTLLICSSFSAAPPAVQNKRDDEVYGVFRKGEIYKIQLGAQRDRVPEAERPSSESDYFANRLTEFQALEDLVMAMIDIYDKVVDMSSDIDLPAGRVHHYDFKTECLKLITEFQLAFKHHQNPSTAQQPDPAARNMHATHSYDRHHEHSSNEDLQHPNLAVELVDGVLQDVRNYADRLEKGMQIDAFRDGQKQDGAVLETVVKMGDNAEDGDASENRQHRREEMGDGKLITLIDQENNQYVLTRPFDTTVWYEAFFGYIMAGCMLGPSGYNVIQQLIQTETLAQLGVVFIVFVLGLEFSIDKIKSMWRLALGGALLILFGSVLCFVIGGLLLGASFNEAIFVGACVSLSSTAVVVKCVKLEELEHLYGLLVMQDVLLGLMLAVIPALARSGIDIMFAVGKLVISMAAFGFISYIIVRAVPLVPKFLRRFRSTTPGSSLATKPNQELLLLGTVATCLVLLLVSEMLGLGMELGCFVGGVVVRSRKGLLEHTLTVIEPVRDLFSCLFFASIGLHVYPGFLASEAVLLLTLTAGVVGFKYIITSIVLVLFRFDLAKSSQMAIGLAQISEFGFVLASRAKQLGIITREVYYLLLAVTSLTLMVTPLVWNLVVVRGGTGIGGAGGINGIGVGDKLGNGLAMGGVGNGGLGMGNGIGSGVSVGSGSGVSVSTSSVFHHHHNYSSEGHHHGGHGHLLVTIPFNNGDKHE